MKEIRALVADDEPLARKKLKQFLDERDDIVWVGEAADGLQAVESIERLHPNLLFLDIQMPGLSGLEVLRRIRSRPHVVFTTAYDKYAVTAFELQAVDYLLKPFNEDRLDRAIARAKQILGTGLDDERPDRFQELSGRELLSRLFVRKRGQIIPVRVADIELLEAGNEYVTVFTENDRYHVSVRLRDLESRLDLNRFIRVHRSYIVNLDRVVRLTPYDGARLQIELANGRKVVASRACSKELRKLAV